MNNQVESGRCGPNNPHPLSTLKTELVWEGKYDEYGNRCEVDEAKKAHNCQHSRRHPLVRQTSVAELQEEQ
ncbi:MAG: hypothetical protein KAY37_15860 [Phycisphaerae bacterium]|nr:hypothetical protein [Phycisphaerae bacterium]